MAKRWTHDEFVNKMAKINPNLEILGTFTSVNNKVLVKCKACGYKQECYPTNMFRAKGNGCQKCAQAERRHTHERFIKEMYEINPNIEIQGRYTKSNVKVKCKCLLCGHEWESTPNSLKKGHGCSECARLKSSREQTNTHESFVERMKTKNPNIQFLSEYKASNIHIKCKCKVCGNEWETNPGTLLSGCGCPKCAIAKRSSLRTKPHDDFVLELKEVHPNITLLSKYEKANVKVRVSCDICGYEWEAIPGSLLFGAGCRKCASKANGLRCRSTHSEFLDKLSKINNNVEILSEYVRSKDKIKCKCKVCGKEYEATPEVLLSGRKCPHCCKNVSSGEIRIMSVLDTYNIEYEHIHYCPNLKGVGDGTLSYDFFLPNYDIFIEYQGEQHSHPIKYFGGEEKFRKQLEHDSRKREYAKKNNIKLLEIWYYDYKNIEQILKKELCIKEAV